MKEKTRRSTRGPRWEIMILMFVFFTAVVCGSVALAKEKATLTMQLWDPGYRNTFKQGAELFTKDNPNIEVKIEYANWSDHWQKLLTRIAGGMPPDMAMHHTGVVREYIRRGFVKNLQPFVDRDIDMEKYFDDYLTANLGESRYPDKKSSDLYGWPWQLIMFGLYYNADLFDEAGVAYPDWDTDRDSFLEKAQKLTKDPDNDGKIDQWGYGGDIRGALTLFQFIYTQGAQFLNDTCSRCIVDSPEAIESLQFVIDLVHKYRVTPSPAEQITGINPFMSSRVAMWQGGSWECNAYKDIKRFKWDIAPVPKGKVRASGDPGAAMMVMFSGTKYPEEAWEYMKHMVTYDPQVIASNQGNIPILKSVVYSELFLGGWPQGRKNLLDQLPYSYHTINAERFFEYSKLWTDQWDLALLGEKSVEDACKTAAAQINDLFEEIGVIPSAM